MKTRHDMRFGATLLPDAGGVRFRLWAPGATQIDLRLDERATLRMPRTEDGWHELVVAEARAGTRYRFVTADGLAVPDPASRANPGGPHEASVVVDPCAHDWQDDAWAGRPWHEAVVYELHVGTFTRAGTYLGAIERLPGLAALGVTAIELMPLAQFGGARGWGYDGVLPYAPHAAYGTPDELKRLVEAAHGLGLMVFLDVVYNHFGPDGNYLGAYCPEFFNPAHTTPWGAAINFDGPQCEVVREFFVQNALYWIAEYRFDGLRMDAIHAIRDDSAEHLCEEVGRALRAFGDAQQPPRAVHLVLENEANLAWLLERDERGRPEAADAQWNDDLHHCAHVLATGETDGYYGGYADQPLARLGRALAEGFVYQGDASPFHEGEPRGEPSAQLPSVAFVSFLQNHDQVGNRALGDRLAALAAAREGGAETLEALTVALLLCPHVPMLFMGEEFAASTPFLYFCDFHGELADAVRNGRRAEFKRFAAFSDPAARERIPDPNAASTFAASTLRWDEAGDGLHAAQRALAGALLAARHAQLVPRLAHRTLGGRAEVTGELLQVEWVLGDGALWQLALNLGDGAASLPMRGTLVHALRADAGTVGARGARVSVVSADDGSPVAAEAQAEVAADAGADDAAAAPVDAVGRPATPDAEPA